MLSAPNHWNGLRTDLVCIVRFAPPALLVSVSFVMIDVAASVRPNVISSLLPRYIVFIKFFSILFLLIFVTFRI